MKAKAALFGLSLLGGSASAEDAATRIYSPSEVLAATKELDGKVIRVRGWLGGCSPNDNRVCELYLNRRAAIGPKPMDWPLPVEFGDKRSSLRVREVTARGTYVVTCRNTETTICVDYDGFFKVALIED